MHHPRHPWVALASSLIAAWLLIACQPIELPTATPAPTATSPAPFQIDGDPQEWQGSAPETPYTAQASGREWIYRGAQGDRRTDPGTSDEADLTELRIAADDGNLYILARMADISNPRQVHLALGLTPADAVPAPVAPLGDDSVLAIGRALLAPAHTISIHAGPEGQIVLEHRSAGPWEAIDGAVAAISAQHDAIEARIPLSALDLTPESDFLLTAVTFQNAPGWNNDADTTRPLPGTDAVDAVSAPSATGNAWDRDLSDGDLDQGWWLHLRGALAAPQAIPWDALYHSRCDQLLTAACPASDHPAVQPVPGLDGRTFLQLKTWHPLTGVAREWETDILTFDDEPVTIRVLAPTTDGLPMAGHVLIQVGQSTPRPFPLRTVGGWEWDGHRGTVLQAAMPPLPPGEARYTPVITYGKRSIYLCRNEGIDRNGAGQWISLTPCPPEARFGFTVLDDDPTGPLVSDVSAEEDAGSARICAAASDLDALSGEGDSDVAQAIVRWSDNFDGVSRPNAPTARMNRDSQGRWCSDKLSVTAALYFRIEATNADTDNGRAEDAERTTTGTYCVGPACATPNHVDDDVRWDEVYHNSRDPFYRSPPGAVPQGTDIRLRIRVADHDLTGADLVVYNLGDEARTFPMQRVPEAPVDASYDWYEATIPGDAVPSPRVIYYKFRLYDGGDEDWYVDEYSHGEFDHEDRFENGAGITVDNGESARYRRNAFDITVYSADFAPPEWAADATIYQIMPDRFRNGDPANDDAWPYATVYGTPAIAHDVWNEAPVDPRDPQGPHANQWSADFFGGDLEGILERLDDLAELGVTAIYLNPVFSSPSNHGYDTTDYLQINPRYGDVALFERLAEEAAARGIRLILDGVFNHTGSDSIYFDRYSHWDASGQPNDAPDGSGACESPTSPFVPFYTFTESPGPCWGGRRGYEGWWGYDTLPLLQENDAVMDFLFDSRDDDETPAAVMQTWYSRGAAGWRFDVADEVSHAFWRALRTQVKGKDGWDGPLYGEVWYEATPWLLGDQMDAVMNYRFRKALLGFLIDSTWSDNDSNGEQTMWRLAPTELDAVLGAIREDYPAPAWYAMMNLVGSHDTNRALFILRERSETLEQALAKMKMLTTFQFAYVGAPTIYYGDEVGLGARDYGGYGVWGAGRRVDEVVQDDPYNRHPYPWPDQPGALPVGLPNLDLLEHYRTLGQARRDHLVLRRGDVVTLLADDAAGIYAFARTLGDECAIAVFNRSTELRTVTLGPLPEACRRPLADLLGTAQVETRGAVLRIAEMPGLSSALLLP